MQLLQASKKASRERGFLAGSDLQELREDFFVYPISLGYQVQRINLPNIFGVVGV
jgi:hypothetical protein